jgi:hypothetical protein
MRETSQKKCRLAALIALSTVFMGSNAAFAATVENGVSLPGIPQAGEPSFSFSDSTCSSIACWYSNYTLVMPTETGYSVSAYNSGDFTYTETAGGEVYNGENGSMLLTAELDQDGNLLAGEYQITGQIGSLGITETEVLTAGNLVDVASEEAVIGFATDNVSCAEEILNCLDEESVYLFWDMAMPDLADLDNTAGFVSTSASLTTVPLPGSAWLFLTGLAVLARKARAGR